MIRERYKYSLAPVQTRQQDNKQPSHPAAPSDLHRDEMRAIHGQLG